MSRPASTWPQMHTASIQLPDVGTAHRPPRVAQEYVDRRLIGTSSDTDRRVAGYSAEQLSNLLRLVGQGIGGRAAFLLLPPRYGRSPAGLRSTRGSSRVERAGDDHRTLSQRN